MTDEKVRTIVREELLAWEAKRQALCVHRTAYLGEDGVTRCELCGKVFS